MAKIMKFISVISSILKVFFVTSILAADFDLLFVFMQRFNRARILKMRQKDL